MSIAYDIGFVEKPELSELDEFMNSLGFEVEPPAQRRGDFTRVYVLCNEPKESVESNESAVREIEFFYEGDAGDHKELFGKKGLPFVRMEI